MKPSHWTSATCLAHDSYSNKSTQNIDILRKIDPVCYSELGPKFAKHRHFEASARFTGPQVSTMFFLWECRESSVPDWLVQCRRMHHRHILSFPYTKPTGTPWHSSQQHNTYTTPTQAVTELLGYLLIWTCWPGAMIACAKGQQNIDGQARIMHNHSAAWWNSAPERWQVALVTTAIPTN